MRHMVLHILWRILDDSCNSNVDHLYCGSSFEAVNTMQHDSMFALQLTLILRAKVLSPPSPYATLPSRRFPITLNVRYRYSAACRPAYRHLTGSVPAIDASEADAQADL